MSTEHSQGDPAADGNPWALPEGDGWGWFRGNLHCHTTESDGRLTPQETVDWFARAGYHFLAITDHNHITDPATVDPRGLCLLPATELTAAGGELGASYHLVALGLPVDAALPATTTPATESLRWLQDRGAVVFIAHPHWSGLTVADLLALTGDTTVKDAGQQPLITHHSSLITRPAVAGIEIYNSGTVLDSQKGEALVHWDEVLARGARWWGVAADDTHWHTLDRGLGWVMVRAPALSVPALLHALAHGHFYASAGPEIRRVSVTRTPDDVQVEVETSPCAAIYLLSYGSRNQFAFDREAAARGELGRTITHASFRARRPGGSSHNPVPYVRVQCVDWQRRSAWSNPFFL